MVGGGDPFYMKFCVNRPPLERYRRFWTDDRSQRRRFYFQLTCVHSAL